MKASRRRRRPVSVEQIAEQFVELVTEERNLLAVLRRIRKAKVVALLALADKAATLMK